MQQRNREIKIDETRHAEERTLLKRLRDAVVAAFMGAILVQVLLFAFKYFILASSIVLWYDNPIFIAWLVGCGIFGWFYGDRFIQTLSRISGEWWNLWDWRL